jgi:lysophospholipase L1-like esterase
MRLHQYRIVVVVLMLFFCEAISAHDDRIAQWKPDIDALTAGDTAQRPPQHGVLFVGSSSIKNWAPTLATDFPHIPVIDRGFGGSQLADSTRFADRIIVPYHPDVVVLYAGDNDINEGRSSDQVVDDFRQFVARVRKDLPHAAIVYITIKPSTSRWKLWPQMRAANEGISAFAKTQKDVRVVDVATRMLDANGQPRVELLLDDGLHMRPAGYAIWIDALKPVLAEYGFAS